MANTTTYEIIGDAEYRVFADGWWADVEYRWDRATDEWRVAVLDTNAYGRVALADIALAANQQSAWARCQPISWSGSTRAAGSLTASASGR